MNRNKLENFIAIDFETASGYHPCSLGLAVVSGGEIVDLRHWLMRPLDNYFDPATIAVHGITPHDVEDAPDFIDLWPEIAPYLDGQLVAAHNAAFDLAVLRQSLHNSFIDPPSIDILCSVQAARRAYPEFASHSLGHVCELLGIPLVHHQADSDARASAAIIRRISADYQLQKLQDITSTFSVVPGYLNEQGYKPCRISAHPLGNTPRISDVFLHKDVAFSGRFAGLTHAAAYELVAKGGGYPTRSLSQSTDWLVISAGEQRRAEAGNPSKNMQQAEQLKRGGHPIRVLAEDEFRAFIQGDLYDSLSL